MTLKYQDTKRKVKVWCDLCLGSLLIKDMETFAMARGEVINQGYRESYCCKEILHTCKKCRLKK